MEKILGLDYGSKTVGVSMSDLMGMIATSHSIIRREKENQLRKTLAQITSICEENKVSKIVLGMPLNIDGTEGPRCEKTLEFKAMLERRTNLEVILWDERLTTVEAEEIMESQGIPRSQWKEKVDMIAASVILQSYLNER
ncbi:MAG: Holliday junction resolvase RuvX [Eubacteriales bacterium]